MTSIDIDTIPTGSPSPSSFFTRSLAHSGGFITLTIFSAAFVMADGVVIVKYWAELPIGMIIWLFVLAYYGAAGGILRIARAHERIREEFLAGKLDESSVRLILNVTLDVAARTWLRAATLDLILILPYLWLIMHIVQHRN